jgi:hypothetical protein
MSTIREQIIEAAVTAVNTGAPVGVPACVRTQMQPAEQAQLPAMTCYPFREEVVDNKTGRWSPLIVRTMYLRFVVYASGNPADGALDPIVLWIGQKLGGSQLGGLAQDVMEHELNWQYDEGNFSVAAVGVDFRVTYQTLRNDPSLSK